MQSRKPHRACEDPRPRPSTEAGARPFQTHLRIVLRAVPLAILPTALDHSGLGLLRATPCWPRVATENHVCSVPVRCLVQLALPNLTAPPPRHPCDNGRLNSCVEHNPANAMLSGVHTSGLRVPTCALEHALLDQASMCLPPHPGAHRALPEDLCMPGLWLPGSARASGAAGPCTMLLHVAV
jgi:hypothetical protein